jgi:hypothetical protein
MQNYGSGNQPAAYFSRKMSAAERNYTTCEQELLAIKEALREWRYYLLGISFDIYSDHESLRYLNSQSDLSGKLLRWNDFISMFDFGDVKIKYIKGINNPVGDALSRPPLRPVHIHVTDDKNELHSMVTLCDVEVSSTTNNLCPLIRQALVDDKEFGQIYSLLTNPKFDQSTSELRLQFSVTDKLLYWMFKSGAEPRLCVPKSSRAALLREHHDVPFCGHMGVDRTYLTLSKDYYWKYMKSPLVVVIVIDGFPSSVYVAVANISVSGISLILFCLPVSSVPIRVLLLVLSVSNVPIRDLLLVLSDSNVPTRVLLLVLSVSNVPIRVLLLVLSVSNVTILVSWSVVMVSNGSNLPSC